MPKDLGSQPLTPAERSARYSTSLRDDPDKKAKRRQSQRESARRRRASKQAPNASQEQLDEYVMLAQLAGNSVVDKQ